MSITNLAYPARSAGAWLVLAALTVTLGLQLLAQLREFRTVGSLAAEICIQATSGGPRDTKLKTPADHRD
jgi:hypothetical protein